MRVGLVCPYPWDVPGGVQEHIRELAEMLLELGHGVSVLTPVDDDPTGLPSYVVAAGRSVAVPYNGSISRLLFGPTSFARARRWVREGDFDVIHVHSPETFSLSLLSMFSATEPIVATYHASNPRSRVLSAFRVPLQTQLEKLGARIAVSPAARSTIVSHVGGDAVLIPNGVRLARYADAAPLPGWPGTDGAVGFIGRLEEPRKGLAVLLGALARLAAARPGLRLLVAGPGDGEGARRGLPAALHDRVVLLGQISAADKPRFYRSVDVFCAPNTGGESFGVVLLEAMAAGTAIAASDLAAFRGVLAQGRAGALAPVGDPVALAGVLAGLLDDPGRRAALARAGAQVVGSYDWPVVAEQIVQVYETVIDAAAARGAHTAASR